MVSEWSELLKHTKGSGAGLKQVRAPATYWETIIILLISSLYTARELVHELSEYLSARYPTVYSVTRHLHRSLDYGWQGKGQISNITIIPLGKTYNLDEEDSMSIAGLLVQDDLAVLLPGKLAESARLCLIQTIILLGPNGKYYFQAGSICLAGSWRLQDKIGMPLAEIHNSADVPQCKLVHLSTRILALNLSPKHKINRSLK